MFATASAAIMGLPANLWFLITSVGFFYNLKKLGSVLGPTPGSVLFSLNTTDRERSSTSIIGGTATLREGKLNGIGDALYSTRV